VTALRWEWRTFGELGARGDRIGEAEPERIVNSDETYVLSAASVDAVKVRHDRMDVKLLERVDEKGLQLWRPVMKSPMPISASEARMVLSTLRQSGSLARDTYDLSELEEAAEGALQVVHVHKKRRHYTFGGCMTEVTDLGAKGQWMRTLAIESENAASVIAAVQELGLLSQRNTSIPTALRGLITQ